MSTINMSREGEILHFVKLALNARVRYEKTLDEVRDKVVSLEESRHQLSKDKTSLDDALGRNVLFGSPTILASIESDKEKN